VRHAVALHHGRAVQRDRDRTEVLEPAHSRPEQDRHEVDVDGVEKARVQALLGDLRAAEACDRALATARKIGMPRVAADALEQSASLAVPDDPVRAEDLHHEALALRAEHGLWFFCVDGLEALAALAGARAEAVRLLAACDRAREEMGRPRTRPTPELREALGDEAYEDAWAGGRELTLRDAVDYARGRRGRPSSGWASLTPTERNVVRLAAQGLSNPDIGSRLFMSRSTVKTHLAHVYAKLGVANRTELATAASPHLTDD
jgi:DNA-binding CsgD family transcriptional regulator